MGKNEQNQKTQTGGFLSGIRGKVLLMGITALGVAVILGAVGIAALRSNNRNQNILTQMNAINLLQYENESLDTLYLYFLDSSYLENITENLGVMGQNAADAKDTAGRKYRDELSSVSDAIASSSDNYGKIGQIAAERGYESTAGLYQQFLAEDEALAGEFAAVADDKSWVDGSWLGIVPDGQNVGEGGVSYLHNTYRNAVPQVGKRDEFLARIGGNGIQYKGTIWVSQIIFQKGSQEETLDLSALTEADLANSYGDALKGLSVGTFQGNPAIAVDAEFTSTDDSWQEVSVRIPIGAFPVQDYENVTYEIYLENGEIGELTAAFALSGKYDFAGALTEVNQNFSEYSKHVVEGAGEDAAAQAAAIKALFEEIASNLGIYVTDEGAREQMQQQIAAKQDAFGKMEEMDNEVLALKQENITLQEQLTELTGSVRTQVEADTAASQSRMIVMIALILIAGAAVLLLLTTYIGRSISRSLQTFKNTLSQMTGGNLSVRAQMKGNDEFARFGKYVNEFLDRLTEVIRNAQDISLVVKQSGEQLDDMAESSSLTSGEIGKAVEEISSGATTQASESDSAAGRIGEMGKSFGMIVENVEHLGTMAEQMHQVSTEAAQFMQELGATNERTVEAFSQVARQTHMTNESVQKIREAAELITSIATQTNLLSLNASIEAARAGDAGRGFAVVATEIQQLAEQSNQSAGIIKKIIEELSDQAQMTVSIVDEVSEIVESQQKKLDETREHFRTLEQGIAVSSRETEQIRRETDICNEARKSVESVITSLSAISEQNAASTEETTASMLELNATIQQLVGASGRLKEMAVQLETDLKFFQL